MTPFALRPMMAAVCFLLLSCAAALAHAYKAGDVDIVHPWSRATPAGAPTGAGYLKLVNRGSRPARLVGAATPVAERVEFHIMSMEGGVMRMRPVPAIDVAPGATVELRPGGLHLMLIGLKRQLHAEDVIPLTLSFADGRTVGVELYVEAAGASPETHGH